MQTKRLLVLNYEFLPLGGGASPVSYELAKRLSETEEYDIDVVKSMDNNLNKCFNVSIKYIRTYSL